MLPIYNCRTARPLYEIKQFARNVRALGGLFYA
jgi:hypothetical protein